MNNTKDGVHMKRCGLFGSRPLQMFLGAAWFVIGATVAQAQVSPPTFSKTFSPSTIGPGSVATLRFNMSNPSGTPATDLAFSDTLPAGVVIATPANELTDCGGVVAAPAGGGTVTFSGGSLGGGASCFVVVNVTSSSLGTHSNVTGDLTSSAGNSGTATSNLAVATDRPGFSKAFAPVSVALGVRSTLTFTIDNTQNSNPASSLTFSDTLPSGMVVAGPSNASTTCTGGSVTAVPGTQIISLAGGTVLADGNCQVAVDVVGTGVGTLVNVSGELTSVYFSLLSSGKATAALQVQATPIALIKSFRDDPVPAGAAVDLDFTIANFNRSEAATSISFTDDLDATLSGLVATGLPLANVCGAGSQLSGTGLLTLTGGSLPPEGQCAFSVTLQVPAGAATGAYPNVTGALSADVGGSGVAGSPGADVLFIAPAPLLTKEFTDDPVGAGDTVTLEFTITNTSPTSAATDIAFIDELTNNFGYPVSVTLPGPSPCGGGSTFSLVNLGFDMQGLSLTGGSLPAGGSCTFSVTIDVPVDQPSGAFTNVTTPISATVDGGPVAGNPATDDLVVVAGPRLVKEFTDDPAQPGGTATLQFTLSHDEWAAAEATGIAFTDDLGAGLAGLAAVGLPQSDICGAGSQISGTSTLSFTGGTLAPGEACAFSVTLQIPGMAPVGAHTNTTSAVMATVAGVGTTSSAASDDLMIAGLVLTKEFTDDPALPGGTVNLYFTIDNISAAEDASGITFRDALNSVLTGLTATGLPLNDICGAGSSLVGLSGNTVLVFSGGSLTAGTSCQFGVTLQVPGAAASNTYSNATSAFSATMGGSTVVFPNAFDQLVVSSERLAISKSFTDDPVFPGGTATLEFTVTNLDGSLAATGITFTDDLDGALAGLTATGLPMNDVCGAGSQIAGSGLVTLTGGSLPPGGSCTFDVATQVPASVTGGSTITNVTSDVSGSIESLPVTGSPASDELLINYFNFGKSFVTPAPAGGRTTLTFTIENLDASAGVAQISFTDDLDAVLPGMAAVGLPAADVCGPGSEISGTSLLSLRDGTLNPGETCTFDVEVVIPASATPGTFDNITSTLFIAGNPSSEPATASLDVEQAAAISAIPTATPLGSLLLIILLMTAAAWLLRIKV